MLVTLSRAGVGGVACTKVFSLIVTILAAMLWSEAKLKVRQFILPIGENHTTLVIQRWGHVTQRGGYGNRNITVHKKGGALRWVICAQRGNGLGRSTLSDDVVYIMHTNGNRPRSPAVSFSRSADLVWLYLHAGVVIGWWRRKKKIQ